MTESHSGPYRIRRLALQVELEGGRMMTFYCAPENAEGAMVQIDMVRPDLKTGGFWHPLAAASAPPPEITFTVGPVNGYIMTLINPEDITHDPIDAARKGIEQ